VDFQGRLDIDFGRAIRHVAQLIFLAGELAPDLRMLRLASVPLQLEAIEVVLG
jgi:hypothetical protein